MDYNIICDALSALRASFHRNRLAVYVVDDVQARLTAMVRGSEEEIETAYAKLNLMRIERDAIAESLQQMCGEVERLNRELAKTLNTDNTNPGGFPGILRGD